MRKLALLAFAFSIAIIACSKDEDAEPTSSKYEGTWDFKSSDGSFDTTLTTNINADGKFSYSFTIGTLQMQAKGDVSNSGVLEGTVSQSGIAFGTMTGNLTTSGTGTGVYVIQTTTIDWEATKQ